MRAMSISTPGSLSRSFISGTRLCPPASELAVAARRLQLRQRIVERRRPLVIECGRNHADLPGSTLPRP